MGPLWAALTLWENFKSLNVEKEAKELMIFQCCHDLMTIPRDSVLNLIGMGKDG